MAGSQSFFHGALGWDDWIWWSAIGAVGLFLLMLMLCCCVCVRRAKRNGRREAIAQANARRREREQQQRAELQYAQAREQQFNQNQNPNQNQNQNPYSYSKPEPPAPYAQPYAQQQQQEQQQPYQDPYARQQPAPYAQQPQQQAPYQDPYAQPPQQQQPLYRDPYNRSPAMAPQQQQPPQPQPKFYPPPASPPPARQTQTQTQYGQAPSPVRLPPTRQMYEGAPEPSNQTSPVHESGRRYQNRSVTAPDQLPLLQYGQTRKNSRPSSRLSGTTLSTQDTFNNTPDTTSNPDDVPFVPVTSPMSLQQRNTFEGFAPAQVPVPPSVAIPMPMQPSNIRDSSTSIPSRASTQSRRGPTLKDRIDALRAGGVQDSNHTRISFGSDQDPLTAAAANAANAPNASPLQSFKQDEKDRMQQSVFQQQLSAKSDLDDSFVSDNSAAFGSSFASVESQEDDRQRTLLTPRDDEDFRRQASRSTDSRESVEF